MLLISKTTSSMSIRTNLDETNSDFFFYQICIPQVVNIFSFFSLCQLWSSIDIPFKRTCHAAEDEGKLVTNNIFDNACDIVFAFILSVVSDAVSCLSFTFLVMNYIL